MSHFRLWAHNFAPTRQDKNYMKTMKIVLANQNSGDLPYSKGMTGNKEVHCRSQKLNFFAEIIFCKKIIQQIKRSRKNAKNVNLTFTLKVSVSTITRKLPQDRASFQANCIVINLG